MTSRRLPTVKQLSYIVALDDLRHFGRAAEKCFISQSAFSVAIRELENLVGAQLVDRTNKSVALTAEGSLFADRARVVVEEIAAMAEAVAMAFEAIYVAEKQHEKRYRDLAENLKAGRVFESNGVVTCTRLNLPPMLAPPVYTPGALRVAG